jgi:sec-independent protein translocase protein TatA
MFGLGPTEVVLILVVGLLLFGAKKLPELGRSLGQGLREFKNASKQIFEDDETPSYASSASPVRQIEVEASTPASGSAEASATAQPDAD